MSEKQTSPPTADQRRAAVIRSLPMLLFTLCAIGVIAILAVSRLFQVAGRAEILDAAHIVCSGAGLSDAAPYKSSVPAPTIAFIEQDGLLQAASNFTREEWRPAEVSEIQLVLCTQSPRPAFRSLCSNESMINQFGGEMPVTLRVAQTGEIVSEGVISGLPIADVGCFETMPSQTDTDLTISNERVHVWLAPYVE